MSKLFRVMAVVAAFVIGLAVLPTVPASAATLNWSDGYPTTGTVTIPSGDTVVLDVDVDLDGLVIDGTLRCGDDDVELKSRYVLVGGAIKCGTTGRPHQGDFTITLTGNGSGNLNGFGDKYLVARPGSTISLHGESRTSWVRITQTAPAGSTTLRLENNDWQVGDRIVIASTDFRPEQAEEAVIVARSGNTVTLDRALEYMHYCGTEWYSGKKVEECAEVGLLTRNITIRGDGQSESSMVGGHVMFHAGSRIKVQDVEFWRMGQVGRTGRYPVHFHLFGDASTSYFRNNSIWRSYNRWVVLHGAQNLRFIDNVGYDTLGHGFYMEDGDEIGNRVVGNLGILADEGLPGQLVSPSDNEASVFWIANPDNYVTNNVAAGADYAGFWYALPERPLGQSPNQHLRPRETPLDRFHKNVAHSVGFAGLYVDRGERPDRTLETTWYNPREVPGDPNSALVKPRFTHFTSYKSRHYGVWLRTFSGVAFRNFTLADNWRSVYIANIQTSGDATNSAKIVRSLMVGETDNIGQPESWEDTGAGGRTLPLPWEPDAPLGGVPFYDGPMHVTDSVFANFQPNGLRDAGALTNLFPNEFWVSSRNSVSGLTFINSNRVHLPVVEEYMDGDATTLFEDRDGSVTGTPKVTITVQGSILDRSSSCTAEPSWNAMVCDPNVGHISLILNRLDGQWGRVEVTRRNGPTMGFDGAGARDTGFFVTLITGMRHELTWVESVPRQFNLYVPDTSRNAGNGAGRISFQAPSGNWEFQVNGQYESAASYDDVTSGPSNWYYDAATNTIHLRLVGDNNWVTMR